MLHLRLNRKEFGIQKKLSKQFSIFKIKEKLAQISGVQPGEFVQVKSPFIPKEITDKYDPDKDSIVFVRSEKDRNEYPKPGMTKKDGSPAYFQHITSQGLRPFKEVGYIDYLDTKEFAGITSATQIREIWPTLDDDQREEFVVQIYPHIKGCLLYTSPSPRDATLSRKPSSA